MKLKTQEIGLYFGMALTGVVVILLVALYAGKPVAPQAWSGVGGDGEVELVFCEKPEWLGVADVGKALAFWSKQGYEFTDGGAVDCSPANFSFCSYQHSSGLIPVPCKHGGVVVTGSTPAMVTDESHGGRTIWGDDWAVIFLPPESEAEPALILAHELGHAAGFGHVKTTIGCVSGSPNGAVMNANAADLGWSAAGIGRGKSKSRGVGEEP